MNDTVNKIEFILSKNGTRVSDLKLQIKVNGKLTTDYAYDSFDVYKVNNSSNSVCDMSKHSKLNSNYILNSNEEYAVEINELSINNMTYSGAIWLDGDTVFINGKEIDAFSQHYCMDTKKEEGKSETFRFTLPKEFIGVEEESNIIQEEIQNTTEIIEQNNNTNNGNNTNNDDNLVYLPILISIIAILIVIIIFLLFKNNKQKNI